MLLDQNERKIASRAQQAGMRNPNIERAPFQRIVDDFLGTSHFDNKQVIDLGPGQYDLSEIARNHGATMDHLENDPAIIELGEYKGFKVWPTNMAQFNKSIVDKKYDGIFCKLSICAFWNDPQDDNRWQYFESLLGLLKEDGWGFIAPWNGLSHPNEKSEQEIQDTLEQQRKIALNAGFSVYLLPEDINNYYGLGGITVDRPLFLKNTKIPKSLEQFLHASP